MLDRALLEIRALPWRPRARVMKPGTLRQHADPTVLIGDDLTGVVIGLGLLIVILVAAPLVVVLLAVALLSVEVPVVLTLALLLVFMRLAGLIPWTVVILDGSTGDERRESYHTLWRAVSRVRGINADRRVDVGWAWA